MKWIPSSNWRRHWGSVLTVVTPAMVALGWVFPHLLSSQSLRSPFADRTSAVGIDFRHQRGASDQKHLVETVGSGCALFDYDNDGWLDILLINGGLTPESTATGPVRHALYRNLGNGRFKEVTAKAGLGGNGAFGMGVAVGDVDNDGDRDVYVTNFGANGLYRNNGDGTFSDVTAKAGVGGSDWSTSAAFFDMENDGDLDLYVTNYLETSFETNPLCELKNIRTYCYPGHYDGVGDRLYQNLGGGRFRDVSEASGILNPEGKGLGVVAADFDDDGWTDLYVANDTERNFHYRNNRQGGFEDMTLLSGTGYNEEANAEAGMGTDAADYDGDGLMDIVVTNYDMETNALYRNHQDWLFTDERASSGVTRGDRFLLGFGTGFFDFDNDGDQDLLVVNGHVLDNVEQVQFGFRYAQPDMLLENRQGTFEEHAGFSRQAGLEPRVGRGSCFGDLDNDGDLDILVNNCGGRPHLLLNRVGSRKNWILLNLIGSRGNRDGVGARIEVTTAAGRQVDQVMGGGGYLGASDLRVHFGLGAADRIQSLRIRWPGGAEEVFRDLDANRILSIREGAGKIEATRMSQPAGTVKP